MVLEVSIARTGLLKSRLRATRQNIGRYSLYMFQYIGLSEGTLMIIRVDYNWP